jgi:predicted transposase YbfD/YdcC
MINRIILDLSKKNNNLNEVIRLRQGENNSTEIQATVTANNQAYDLSGSTVELHMKKPDYEVYVEKATIDNNEIICKLTSDAVKFSGKATAYFQITNKDSVVSTENFKIDILPALNPVKKKDPNEPQPIDLQVMNSRNEKKGEGLYFG